MSCIDAAIISEMNKQKTNNANSITTKSITCDGNITTKTINHLRFATNVDAGEGTIPITIDDSRTHVGHHIVMHNKENEHIVVLYCGNDQLRLFVDKNDGTDTIYATLWGGSQTVSHRTNVDGEIGTFCEATGEIYDGYEEITNTDCICKVKSASTLSNKVVGIITRDNEFASHGDALVKVVPGPYNIGDILAPAENGYGRKATNEELQFMLLNSLPMVKITSMNTGIANTVATFIR